MMICVLIRNAQSVWNLEFMDYYCDLFFALVYTKRPSKQPTNTTTATDVSIVCLLSCYYMVLLFLALILLYACYWYLTKSKYISPLLIVQFFFFIPFSLPFILHSPPFGFPFYHRFGYDAGTNSMNCTHKRFFFSIRFSTPI